MIDAIDKTTEDGAVSQTAEGDVTISGHRPEEDDLDLFVRFKCQVSPDPHGELRGAEFSVRYQQDPQGQYWEADKGFALRSFRHCLRRAENLGLEQEAQAAREMIRRINLIDAKTALSRTGRGEIKRPMVIKPTEG